MSQPSPEPPVDGVDPADTETAQQLLRHGRLEVQGRLVSASNRSS